MRYVQLRAFHHVALAGSFSRAARTLHLTQPAISDQVRWLEEEYDAALFVRKRRQIELTPAGSRLLVATRRLFDAEGEALEVLQEERSLRAGMLRIAADSVDHVLEVLTVFQSRFPGIQIKIVGGNSHSIVEYLLAYDVDIGVLGDIVDERPFEVFSLNVSPVVLFVAQSHPLATRASLPLEALSAWPLVMREQGSRTRQMLETLAEAQGVALRCAVEAEGREAVRRIVAAGLGIGVVSEAEFDNDPRLVKIALEGHPLSMQEKLICLKDRRNSKSIQAFFATARSVSSEARSDP
ncbi:LysR substrate-binding domain-containing protein [Sinorhizobium sp. RAC02]|uniref:LysR substrate-binding domain-containing protein n=1 Tax=Sinorhizobium sp. RAC02 TaxID=1842534 RepID=UPI00083E0EF2|nr:LysR substrate-binding domain-containing protein [Sinorhizobium sp. RAC02]AOF93221.1 bacterial regulatory helix-turn-helix, lysR family protein [Sinorhizobium sp. RAC02]